VVALGVLSCGRWCTLIFCGACGGNKMIEISRTKKGRLRSSRPSYFPLYTWTVAHLAPLVISFNDFLILFSSPN
jgi:hypothetical protein